MDALKNTVIEKIKTDPILFGQVAKAVGVIPSSLTRLLIQNHVKLTQAGVLQVLRDHYKTNDDTRLLAKSKKTAAAA